MNFENLMEMATKKVNESRNVCTLLSRPDFAKLYEAGTPTEKDQVIKLVTAGASEALRAWYRSKLSKELGDKSVRELREIASALTIPDYTRLSKALLLSEIVKRQKDAQRHHSADQAAPQ